MPADDALVATAREWLRQDPDPETRAELATLIEQGDPEALYDRFYQRLAFGTAGLRGVLGAGPNRMNRVVVQQATAGLCLHLLSAAGESVRTRGICIGYDGRTNSRLFAEDAAAVITAMGIAVWLFDRIASTPTLAFSVVDRGAAAGIMITASHNPPEYNGYKVYWSNGAQIIPPQDQEIAAQIANVATAELSSIARLSLQEAETRGLLRSMGDAVEQRYLEGVARLTRDPGVCKDIPLAYTALHGVGERLTRAAFERAGYTRLESVPEQAQPDATFPTVRFPNPEEPGAMDRVVALAKRTGAALALAQDPDADRLAVAVRDASGEYHQLTGNELGCLIAHRLLTGEARSDGCLVISSIVSSPMLGVIADHCDARWEQTLTGFKWIANRALELESAGLRFIFGYEEALGYTVGTLTRDKDGIGTALVVAHIAAQLRYEGKTLLDELEVMARTYGLFVSRQLSRTLPGAEGAHDIAQIMSALRERPPEQLAGRDVTAVTDLLRGSRTANDGSVTALALPTSNVLSFDCADGTRVMLRPSGTEPKIKAYVDVRVDVSESEALADARTRAESDVASLAQAIQSAMDTALSRPQQPAG